MNTAFELSVAICTRNRHEDLWNCLKSIGIQKNVGNDLFDVMIVDDGDTSKEWIESAGKLLPDNMVLSYYRKPKEDAGLLKSRLLSVDLARNELLLFLDDDVECEEDYFYQLKKTFQLYPDAVGISGADQGFVSSTKGRMLAVVSGQGHPSVGKLSWGGFASSMNRWNKSKVIFETEFLHGCNMCYRKSALREVQAVDWLNGYSLGEDLYLSFLAGHYGKMYVNPELKLVHHGSPTSRDKREIVAYTKILNHYYLLQLNKNKGKFHYFMFLWTAYFLYFEQKLQKNKEAANGFRRGIRELHLVRAKERAHA